MKNEKMNSMNNNENKSTKVKSAKTNGAKSNGESKATDCCTNKAQTNPNTNSRTSMNNTDY